MHLSHRPLSNWLSPRSGLDQSIRRSANLAGLLSMLVPGLGQLYLGRLRPGGIMLGLSGLSAIGALLLWNAGPIALLSFLVRPKFLFLIFVLNLVVFAFRMVAVRDAIRTTAARSAHGYAIAVLLFAFTSLPHLALGYYDIVTIDLLNEVFDNAPDEQRNTGTDGEYKLTIPVSPNLDVTVVPTT